MGDMRPEQLEDLVTLSAPTLHPDGAFAVVAVSHPSFAVDAEVGQLWRVPLDGSGPRRITRGFRDSAPTFSPDGRLLAFVRSQPGKPGQVFIAPADGGEPMQVTDQKLSLIHI